MAQPKLKTSVKREIAHGMNKSKTEGESRVELLNWVNSLLKLNYVKIEQLGSGAAYAQIFDSIWGMKKLT